ncbi:hypothetical protein OPT61_g7567 [Boeremia exigua]|uniref:Uncharacterized protein n=1 Tax=Boeremia exigua TaxID=749465 RepID=A0ACC2I335_9PLEO|nr:hypothetical protein OPT61_g7567 [Boeremia exigua]
MSHKISLEVLAECCMELSLDVSDNSIRGWFTSNQLADMVGPMFYIQDDSTTDLLPLIAENVSWDSLQDGIQECLQHHESCRNDEGLELPLGFRVIDIDEQCIVEIQSKSCDFFALSYVWGLDNSPRSKTTKASYASFLSPGALSRVALPQTVRDAMTACAQLKQKYLWADRLCIVQDSPEDKANQILAMDRIYRLAKYVIIAYDSDDMNSGISGISRPRPQTQMRVKVAGLYLTSDAFDDFCNHTHKGCVWLKRGWTYQEYELAKRKLGFRNTQAFLECRHGRKEEYRRGFGDIGDELWTARRVDPLFSRFALHIKAYSRRKLSFLSDGIAAVTGVLNSLYEGKGRILGGLPEAHFDRALLWYGDLVEYDKSLNSSFPSWSWASILGACTSLQWIDAAWRGHAHFRSYEFCGTLVPWYTVDADGCIRPVNNIPDDQIRNRWKSYAAIAYEGGCVANSRDDLEYFLSPAETWPDYASYIRQVVPEIPSCLSDTFLSDESLHDLYALMRKDMLLTQAQTVTLRWTIDTDTIGLFETNGGILFLGPDGNRVGQITLILSNESQYEQVPAKWGSTVEVMGISLAILTRPGEEAHWPDRSVVVEGQDFPDIPVVNVLVIERIGKCVRRRALGWVCLADWLKLEKKWEYILLE